jgi:glycosyltransferase involved in cell wall biosynthesis
MKVKQKKIAIVYDWIDKWGGVERVLLDLYKTFPDAIFYTSYYDKEKAGWAKDLEIRTSFIQKLPNFIKKNRILSFIFYPFVFESFDFGEFDLVISVTSSFAKSIITRPGTKHICYLLTPTRYLWSHKNQYIGKSYGLWVRSYVEFMKKWDFVVAQRPDKIISISETVRERCLKYYKRESEVVYPGFDIEYWKKIKLRIKNEKLRMKLKIQNYFLIVARLETYKKVDLVIRLFNRLNYSLVIVGEGSQELKLKKIARNNISFLKKLSDVELGLYYSNAKALIMPQEEDFGYVSLEAQAFDCPVIAFNKGGAKETIVDGKSGIFFLEQTEEALLSAIERFEKIEYNLKDRMVERGKKNVERFGRILFVNNFKKYI